MKLVPSSPLMFLVVIVVIFAVGLLFGKMFNKKTEKFDSVIHGIPSTVQEFAASPKVLAPVPTNKGVTTHDDWCGKFNC
ncbi:hypothetical protein PBCVCVM1_601L [Paramecium bursaria Chlorella virus CVM-1]|nr:hypothetical protein PBCVCVG1_564L [Paramecium bursaria Chlorella virus CVG-1]AGE51900.1 hypothetical protein PBCVCVM1_601L [Paramecium bursaria Chlorella virus CVM-1]